MLSQNIDMLKMFDQLHLHVFVPIQKTPTISFQDWFLIQWHTATLKTKNSPPPKKTRPPIHLQLRNVWVPKVPTSSSKRCRRLEASTVMLPMMRGLSLYLYCLTFLVFGSCKELQLGWDSAFFCCFCWLVVDCMRQCPSPKIKNKVHRFKWGWPWKIGESQILTGESGDLLFWDKLPWNALTRFPGK